VIWLCVGANIVANRPARETDLSADFTYVDGYDAPAVTPPQNVRGSQPKLFSLFRSKKSASPTTVNAMQTTITAGSYSGPTSGSHSLPSSVRRRDVNPMPYQQQQQQQQLGLPQLLVTAPSRPDTTDFTDVEWGRGGGIQNPGQPSWQTANAVQYSQPGYGHAAGGGGGGGFVVNGSHPGWSHQNVEFETAAFQTQNYAALQNASPYADGNADWSTPLQQHEGWQRRSPRLGGPQRSFDDHWAADGDRTAAESYGWDRRKSLPSIVKLPATPAATTTTATKTTQRVSNAGETTNAAMPRRPQLDTYVIDNGVRKRVR